MTAETYLKKRAKQILKATAQGIAAITLSITLSQPSCGTAHADPAPPTNQRTGSSIEYLLDYDPPEQASPEPEYAWPVPETEQNWNVMASCYGERQMDTRRGFHNGIDIGIGEGTPVVAIADGTVVHSCEVSPECNCSTNYEPCKSECSGKEKQKKSCYGWGTTAIIQHKEDMFAQYLHLQSLTDDMKPGQTVKKGQVIGYSGNTGRSIGAHLHFSIHKNWHIPAKAKDKSRYSRDPLELYAKKLDKLDLTRHNCGEAYVRLARNSL